MAFGCKTSGKIVVSDETDTSSRYGISGVEWGVWNVISGQPAGSKTRGPSSMLLYWSKWDLPFVAASQCQMTEIFVPSGRVIIEGGDPKEADLPRAFPVGSSICELYTHTAKSGRIVGVTVLPVASRLWNRPDSPLLESRSGLELIPDRGPELEPRGELGDNPCSDHVAHHQNLSNNLIKRLGVIKITPLGVGQDLTRGQF